MAINAHRIQTTVLANQSDPAVYILALRIYIKSVQSAKPVTVGKLRLSIKTAIQLSKAKSANFA